MTVLAGVVVGECFLEVGELAAADGLERAGAGRV